VTTIYQEVVRVLYCQKPVECRPSVCLSVRPSDLSVTLVDQDHKGLDWKSCKLTARTISLSPSLFVAQRGRLEMGWEKVACWMTKAAISLKRVKIEEKLLWIELTNALSNGIIPYGLLFPKIGGSQPPPKISIAIISGKGKATDSKFGQCIHRVHPNNNPFKILERYERGRIRGCPIC